jgi:hypothetical protein
MGFVRDLTGKTAANAAIAGGDIQSAAATDAAGSVAQAGEQAGALFDPLAQLGQSGVQQAGFLTDPKAQFDFLQNNPLFQMGLDNANTQTNQFAAARGRLSAGDTLQQLNQNALLTASPLIQQQKQSIGDLLSIGQGAIGNQANILQNTASNQGNLLTGAAAAQAAGIVGAANARGAGASNLFGAALSLGGAALASPAGTFGGAVPPPPGPGIGGAPVASDPKLKANIVKVGTENGHNTYTWDWNDKANGIGLFGSSTGVMADEVKAKKPEAVTMNNGYMQVDYSMIGVKR